MIKAIDAGRDCGNQKVSHKWSSGVVGVNAVYNSCSPFGVQETWQQPRCFVPSSEKVRNQKGEILIISGTVLRQNHRPRW